MAISRASGWWRDHLDPKVYECFVYISLQSSITRRNSSSEDVGSSWIQFLQKGVTTKIIQGLDLEDQAWDSVLDQMRVWFDSNLTIFQDENKSSLKMFGRLMMTSNHAKKGMDSLMADHKFVIFDSNGLTHSITFSLRLKFSVVPISACYSEGACDEDPISQESDFELSTTRVLITNPVWKIHDSKFVPLLTCYTGINPLNFWHIRNESSDFFEQESYSHPFNIQSPISTSSCDGSVCLWNEDDYGKEVNGIQVSERGRTL
uniref:Uncharacterized protein n=1 Tax=Soybean thrips rhabdo-like virus 3 TaxID=2796570 RepID=A0A7T3R0N1_9RHAB|nr:hypothetical protein 2 [Soybean thrips rhabdo-like virus 3]